MAPDDFVERLRDDARVLADFTMQAHEALRAGDRQAAYSFLSLVDDAVDRFGRNYTAALSAFAEQGLEPGGGG